MEWGRRCWGLAFKFVNLWTFITQLPFIDMIVRILIALLAMAAFVAEGYCEDWAKIGRYADDNRVVASRIDANDHLVVFMGNSITDRWPASNEAFFRDNNFLGRGISGQTTYQFLVRFNDDVVNLHPEAVVINGGINDIAENNYAYDETRTFGNIRAMSEIAEANGIKVILTSVLPADRFGWRPDAVDIQRKVASLNRLIKALADKKGYRYVDYYSVMADPATGGMKAVYSDDGVHPTDSGYRMMESIVLPVVRGVVAKP